mmetsp:Transcript_23480/g.44452  ORF Transcript_23480/g.44452 Transcript_23480/m.44452 type:complete len:692 (+) Transcript_23480:206-2281(+)
MCYVTPRSIITTNDWLILIIFLCTQSSKAKNNLFASASRAYPHGCMYRHPSYYTYDEREDTSWADAVSINDGFDTGQIGNQMLGDPMGHMTDYENNLGSVSDTGGTQNTILGGNRFHGYQQGNNNEFYADQSYAQYTDFRVLPPKTSPLRRPYKRYRLTRRLGAGKFSDVFEAVDVVWENARKREIRRKNGKSKIKVSFRSSEELGGLNPDAGESTEDASTEVEAEDREDGDEVDPRSLVVLKCLKPISERKIRRELLVLTHCETLPNLARLIGIVIPDSMDESERDDGKMTSLQHSQKLKTLRRKGDQKYNHQAHRSEPIVASKQIDKHELPQSKTMSSLEGGKAVGVENQATNNHDETQLPALVLEHAGQNSQWFCHTPQHQKPSNGTTGENDGVYLTEYEMKYYLCHLLIALDGLHSAGIMHRDVKPRNCLINRFDHPESGNKSYRNVDAGAKRDYTAPKIAPTLPLLSPSSEVPYPLPPPPLMLVDLGLADFYLPGKEYNVRVASRHYKSPELLIGYKYYDYAIDMWSVGCCLAGLLFRREPFFRGKDNEDQLGKIVSVLGTRDFLPYYRKCNVRLSSKARAAIGKYCAASSPSTSTSSSDDELEAKRDIGQRRPWLSFLSPSCPIPSHESLDLLDRLLVYDHEQRWTAREALGHSWFDEVREDVWREVQERMLWESQWRSVFMQRR